MPFSWFVALRYLREGRMQTALILGAVAIGVAVLVFLSALIGGLQVDLIAKTLGSQAHIVVRPPEEAARPQAQAQAGELLLPTARSPRSTCSRSSSGSPSPSCCVSVCRWVSPFSWKVVCLSPPPCSLGNWALYRWQRIKPPY